MRPRIAIPLPHSGDPEYAQRAYPQYAAAVESAGGEPVQIPLNQTPAQIMKVIERCDAAVLPGSKADVDPPKYGAVRDPKCGPSDPGRDTVDELLLQDAYNMRKPVLGICYGMQSLNVYRSGTLIQDIESPVNHRAGRQVAVAHTIEVALESKLAGIVATQPKSGEQAIVDVNSSHHQSVDLVGDGLRVVARCPDDGIIEAVEGTSSDHFVLAVQWHPERTFNEDERSRAIFRALVDAAKAQKTATDLADRHGF